MRITWFVVFLVCIFSISLSTLIPCPICEIQEEYYYYETIYFRNLSNFKTMYDFLKDHVNVLVYPVSPTKYNSISKYYYFPGSGTAISYSCSCDYDAVESICYENKSIFFGVKGFKVINLSVVIKEYGTIKVPTKENIFRFIMGLHLNFSKLAIVKDCYCEYVVDSCILNHYYSIQSNLFFNYSLYFPRNIVNISPFGDAVFVAPIDPYFSVNEWSSKEEIIFLNSSWSNFYGDKDRNIVKWNWSTILPIPLYLDLKPASSSGYPNVCGDVFTLCSWDCRERINGSLLPPGTYVGREDTSSICCEWGSFEASVPSDYFDINPGCGTGWVDPPYGHPSEWINYASSVIFSDFIIFGSYPFGIGYIAISDAITEDAGSAKIFSAQYTPDLLIVYGPTDKDWKVERKIPKLTQDLLEKGYLNEKVYGLRIRPVESSVGEYSAVQAVSGAYSLHNVKEWNGTVEDVIFSVEDNDKDFISDSSIEFGLLVSSNGKEKIGFIIPGEFCVIDSENGIVSINYDRTLQKFLDFARRINLNIEVNSYNLVDLVWNNKYLLQNCSELRFIPYLIPIHLESGVNITELENIMSLEDLYRENGNFTEFINDLLNIKSPVLDLGCMVFVECVRKDYSITSEETLSTGTSPTLI